MTSARVSGRHDSQEPELFAHTLAASRPTAMRRALRILVGSLLCMLWSSAAIGQWEWTIAYHDYRGFAAHSRWYADRTPTTEAAWVAEKARMDAEAAVVTKVRWAVLFGAPIAGLLLFRVTRSKSSESVGQPA
jgi:hypothetical protein